MPRHIIRPSSRSPRHDRFVKKLVQELKSPGEGPQPLILEEEIPSTRSRHVNVIWDQFAKLSEEERADVILEAYKQAEGLAYAEEITIASGLTPQEAFALGFLPWKVDAPRKREDQSAEREYAKAVEEEMRNTVLPMNWMHELRYARKEDAEAAVQRLLKKTSGLKWALDREADMED